MTIVLKFGSSVLRAEPDLASAVHEIYRHVRAGHAVVAVVSAIGDTTDALIARSRAWHTACDTTATVQLLSTGEQQSAALLSCALARAGLSSAIVPATRGVIRTRGNAVDAEPIALDAQPIRDALARCRVAIVPGFVGIDGERGGVTLLGRGGSDLTAVCVAHALGLGQCTLLKDVSGVYTSDPNAPGARPRRYGTLSWNDALRVGGRLVQRKAIEAARNWNVSLRVTSIGSADETLIGGAVTRGAENDACAGGESQFAPLRVALLGLGVVGYGVYQRLAAFPHLFDVTRIAVRRPEVHLAKDLPEGLLTANAWDVFDDGPDVLVELIGGTEPAGEVIERALRAGVHVVTANKEVVAQSGDELRDIARERGAALLYSAAVGGGAPVIESIDRIARTDRVTSIRAVLNGTCNYILDRLHEGESFENALGTAQRLGFAEADPTLDTEGFDTAYKLAIACGHAFGESPDAHELDRTGITGVRPADACAAAAENGKRLRLVARAERSPSGRVRASVSVEPVDADDPLAAARGEQNVCVIGCESGARHVVRGAGAGRWPTTESVFADLLDIARNAQHPAIGPRHGNIHRAQLREAEVTL